MPISQLDTRCWIVPGVAGVPAEEGGATHYADRADAEAWRAENAPSSPEPVETVGCWAVFCDEQHCEDRPEDDEYGPNIHCGSRAEAEEFAKSCGWVVLPDGQVFCTFDAPEVPAGVPAGPVPGQLMLGEGAGDA